MCEITIRSFKNSDIQGILKICYRTGYMGESLHNRDIFNDVKLFGYLFCIYYPYYEPDNVFLAVDQNDKIVGYIMGTDNSKKQEDMFKRKMVLKIAIRALLYTSWKYRESFKALMFFIKNLSLKSQPKNLYKEYPAHLHMNVLPEYQHMGIGSKLINVFEKHIKEKGVQGIHLRTSNNNIKALPFYEKKGYVIMHKDNNKVWKGVENYENLILGKKLK